MKITYNKYMELKYTGIMLGKYDIGEADRIYTIYTKEAGKIQAKAVGVKKQNAKLAGALENFTLADIAIVKKNGTGKITSSIVENNFPGIKNNFEAVAAVFGTAEIFNRLVGTGERDEKIFNLLKDYLESVNAENDENKIEVASLGFIFQLLSFLGYKIEVGKCAGCGAELKSISNFFSAEQGGIVCQNCASGLKNVLPVSVNAIKLARLFLANSLKSLAKIKASEKEIRELRLVSRVFLDWIAK